MVEALHGATDGRVDLLAVRIEPLDVEVEVRVFGEDPAEAWPRIRPRVGVVMQHVDDQLLGLTALDDVELGLRGHVAKRSERREKARQALRRVGVEEFADRVPVMYTMVAEAA